MDTKKKIKTVAVSGAFDPLHAGHIRYIREAAKLGDRLVVILNSDAFLLRKKGFIFRPFEERKEIIESIKGVDEVIAAIDDDQTVRKTLEIVQPDIFAKGGYWTVIDNIPEADVCLKIGCKLLTNVGGSKLFADKELDSKLKDYDKYKDGRVLINCPYCENHPILRERCSHCGTTGKVDVTDR